MIAKFKVRNVDIEIEFEPCDDVMYEFEVLKVADSENEDLKECFYNLIEFAYKTELFKACLEAIETHNEQIKIERYLDADPR